MLHSKPLDFYCSSSAILTEQQIGHKEGHVYCRLENTQERTDRFRSSCEVTYCANPVLYLLLPIVHSWCLHCSGNPWLKKSAFIHQRFALHYSFADPLLLV